jgi:hypothetical protein
MADGSIKLTNPDQLDTMSQAHRAHGDAAHTLGQQVSSGQGTLQGTTNWSGPGFDDLTGFLQQFSGHLHAFGDVKYKMAAAVTQSKNNHLTTESTNTQNMTTSN